MRSSCATASARPLLALEHEPEPQLEVEAVARRGAGRDGERDRGPQRPLGLRPVGLEERPPARLRVQGQERRRRVPGARGGLARLALEPRRLRVAPELGQLARMPEE